MHATLDERGRVTLPAELRRALRLEAGDTLVFEVDDCGRATLVVAREPLRITHENLDEYLDLAENPFEALAMAAEAEYRSGTMRDLADVARDLGVPFDG
jgi:AbrB family looped-hinge helix DNA binding protein